MGGIICGFPTASPRPQLGLNLQSVQALMATVDAQYFLHTFAFYYMNVKNLSMRVAHWEGRGDLFLEVVSEAFYPQSGRVRRQTFSTGWGNTFRKFVNKSNTAGILILTFFSFISFPVIFEFLGRVKLRVVAGPKHAIAHSLFAWCEL